MPDPDADVIPWVVEFLLRQPLPSSLPKPLLRSILPSSLSPRLTKTLLLRRLSDDLSLRIISSVTLHSLELLADSSGSSPVLSAAYAAAAVHLTVKPLKDSSSISDFFEAVNRIWNRGVADLEACSGKRKGLVSTGLREARREMEAAVVDAAVREELVGRGTEGRALEALRECLEEVEKELGPTFLELAAEAVSAESRGKNLEAQLDRPLGESCGKVEALRAGRGEKGDGLLGSDDRAENIHAKLDLKQTSLYRVKGIGHSENTSVVDRKNNDSDAVFEHEHMDEERSNLNDVEQTQKGVFVKSNFGFVGRHIEGGNGDKATFTKRDDNRGAQQRPSIMERNPTAHTYEWDDSLQSPFAYNPPEELRFSSPKNGEPFLDVEDNMQFILRKRRKKWSPLEEETLRKAVERHGAGRWKFIKNCHPKIFKDRTEVDLKDKWRNLMRQY